VTSTWVRPTSRVLVLDPDQRLLLLGSWGDPPEDGDPVRSWADRTIDTRETFFVVRDVEHEVDGGGRAALELAADEPHRWWDPAEIAADGVTFAPRELPAAFPALLSGPWTGPPRIVR
jgi:hypothetical protein